MNSLLLLLIQVTCSARVSGRRRTVPVVVAITDLNDNGPVFLGLPYAVTIPEVITTTLLGQSSKQWPPNAVLLQCTKHEVSYVDLVGVYCARSH